jgi:hypothetical protein
MSIYETEPAKLLEVVLSELDSTPAIPAISFGVRRL